MQLQVGALIREIQPARARLRTIDLVDMEAHETGQRGPLRPLMRALAVELLQSEAFTDTMREVFVARRRDNIHVLVQRAIKRDQASTAVDVAMICDLLFGTMWYRLMFDHAPLDDALAEALAALAASHALS